MLYKRNTEKRLSDDLFYNPTSEYRGTPFWSWNCKLSSDELLRQIDCLAEMGFGGFHMHSRTGMATPYLTEEFFDLIKACVNKAKDKNMLAWLYDEDRWPSGAAGGIVTRDNPELRQRYVIAEPTAPQNIVERSVAVKTGGAYLIGCYDIKQNSKGELIEYKKVSPDDINVDAEDNASDNDNFSRWYFTCYCSGPSQWYNNATYIDTLNPDAADKFINVTYDAYKAHVGEDFGASVPAIFTDEPQFASKRTLGFSLGGGRAVFPWTPRFPEVFVQKYGYDILSYLPELIFELPDDKVSVARYHFHDNIAEMFTAGFNDKCGSWCEHNGISFTGHLMEEPTLESQTHAVGDAMRCYRNMQLPGIDMLCDRVELTTAKQTQSAVHQYGREGMASELYGVTNWDFDFRGHKFQGDWQAALGVTVRVPHLSWVSMEGNAKRDYPASINYQSPWYRDYKYVEDHFARVNTAMTRGKPLINVGVIHPVESYWLHFGPNDLTASKKVQLEENFSDITRWLLEGTIDFNYICESTLPTQYKSSQDGLCVGEMTYDAVIIPACETMRATTYKILNEFRERGGKLIFAGPPPRYIDAAPSELPAELSSRSFTVPFSRTAILDALKDERKLSIKNHNGTDTDNLVYAMRRDFDCDWLFIAHIKKNICLDVSHPQYIKISVSGEYTPYFYDTVNGTIENIDFNIESSVTVINTVLYAYDSLLLRLDRKVDSVPETILPKKEKLIKTVDYRSPLEYSLSEPNVLLLDTAYFAVDDNNCSDYEEEILRADNICRLSVGLGRREQRPAQPWVCSADPPQHKIRLKFIINSDIEFIGAKLALECPETAEIDFNGEKIDKTVTGYFTDKSIKTLSLPKIGYGKNILEITYPLGIRTNTEWCYIIGNFGVKICGCEKTIINKPDKIGFGSVTSAGMPFYSGNITYKLTFNSPESHVVIRVGTYRGAAVKISLDGGDSSIIAYEPYTLDLGRLKSGTHEIALTLLGTRINSFGALHDTDYGNDWYGPDKWRTSGESWCYEYKIKDMGVLTSPVIYLYE